MQTGINNEEWKNIDGYLNYQVSNLGRVRNSFTGRILKQQTSHQGYLVISLRDDSKKHKYSVHRLVAKEFIPNPLNLPQIDHIDNEKTNNTITNLRWVNNSQNQMNMPKRNGVFTSVYKGVNWHKGHQAWVARVGFENKRIHLGDFETAKEAAKAYNEKATELFGEYAKLNEISDDEDTD